MSRYLSFLKVSSPPPKKTNNKIQIQTYTVFTHSSCVNTKTYRCAHIHIHKAPSRTKAYTDIKGPLFSPSYRYSTGGLCCVHLRLCHCVFVSVCDTMYGVNSYRHPRHTELHGFVCTGILVLCELLRKKKQQFHQQCSQKQNNCAFDGVCLWWWGDRK